MVRAIFVIGVGGTPIAERFVLVFLTGMAIGMFLLLIWFCLCSWTFRRLRIRHAAIYETIGSPSLFWNNSPRNNFLFLKFLYRLNWRVSGDRTLVRVCWSMLVLSAIYFCLFAAVLCFFQFTTFWRK
jgi:hypothetical protein